MEPIIRLKRTCTFDTSPDHWYFHDVEKAKKFAQRDWDFDGDIIWGKGASPDYFYNENELRAGEHYFKYTIEPITITVLDEDDGEV